VAQGHVFHLAISPLRKPLFRASDHAPGQAHRPGCPRASWPVCGSGGSAMTRIAGPASGSALPQVWLPCRLERSPDDGLPVRRIRRTHPAAQAQHWPRKTPRIRRETPCGASAAPGPRQPREISRRNRHLARRARRSPFSCYGSCMTNEQYTATPSRGSPEMPSDRPERRRVTHSPPVAGGLRDGTWAVASASGDGYCPPYARSMPGRVPGDMLVTYPLHAHGMPVLYPLHTRHMPGSVRKVVRVHARPMPGKPPGDVPASCPYLEAIS
jgi:hypothetical protein